MKVTTSERLKELMIEKHLKQVDVITQTAKLQNELNIKMGKSTFSQYINGKQSPDQDRIYLLSKFFDVSEPWLMGFDVPKKRVQDGDRHEEVTVSIESLYNQLEEPRQKKVYSFAEKQLEEQNKVVDFPTIDDTGTLAAHSADPDKQFDNDKIDKINSYLDKLDEEYDSKHKNN